MGTAIALNYVSNIIYVVLFCKYIRPLLNNPRQIDNIAHGVTLALCLLTNYSLGLIAYSRMFPKPYVHISNPSKLTPVHYLCIASLLLDLLPLIACGLAIYN